MSEPLWRLTAMEAVDLLRAGEVTPLDLIDALEARIATVEPAINALPTVDLARAREQAKRLMDNGRPADPPPGYLYGLPIVVKDLNAVAGMRWTEGSRVFADRIADRSDFMVERLESSGAIPFAKSNTPEFGAGGTTVNDVFGHTLNPWDLRMTCGGSSGGSAAALTTGEAWLATGNDLGGSLRLPASFCSVVGFRPSPGRVPHGPEALPYAMLNVDGPMARNVADVALMLDAMAGQHPGDPISLAAPTVPFLAAVRDAEPPRRVAWGGDLGICPIDPEVRAICESAIRDFETVGAKVEAAHPDFSDADATFQVLRAMQRAGNTADLLREKRDRLSKEVIFYAEKALSLSTGHVVNAELARAALFRRMVAFFQDFDLLVTPAVMVPPFDYRERHVMAVDGVAFDDYFTWLRLTFAITLTSCPALSLPCGFTRSGLPVGLQIIAPPRSEAAALSAAALLEARWPYAGMLPIDPRTCGVASASAAAE